MTKKKKKYQKKTIYLFLDVGNGLKLIALKIKK